MSAWEIIRCTSVSMKCTSKRDSLVLIKTRRQKDDINKHQPIASDENDVTQRINSVNQRDGKTQNQHGISTSMTFTFICLIQHKKKKNIIESKFFKNDEND